MLRFRFFLPLMAPVLAVVGWWWYASRKKKETTAPEDEVANAAVGEALKGLVETLKVGQKAGEGNAVELVKENHILPATAEMLNQSLASDTQVRMGTPSPARHSGLTAGSAADCLESCAQEVPDEQASSTEEAEEAETRTRACRSLPNDGQVPGVSESGSREGLEDQRGVVVEGDATLAPRPTSRFLGTAVSQVSAPLPNVAGRELETVRDTEPENLSVPFPENLPVLEDQTFKSATSGPLSPEVVTASCHYLTMSAPPSDTETKSPPQEYVLLNTPPVLNPTVEEANGPSPMASQEEPVVQFCDVTEQCNGRSLQPSNSFPLSGHPQCTVEELGNSQTCMKAIYHLVVSQVDDLTEQTSKEIQLLMQGGSSLSAPVVLAKDEPVPNAYLVPLAQEEVEEVGGSGTEIGQKAFRPEDCPSSLVEPQPDIIGTEDSGCSTGQLERTGAEGDGMPSDQSSGSTTRMEILSLSLDQADREDDHTSNSMHHPLQEAPISEVPADALREEASQNGLSSPVQDRVVDVSPSRSRMASLEKSLIPETTPWRPDKPPEDHKLDPSTHGTTENMHKNPSPEHETEGNVSGEISSLTLQMDPVIGCCEIQGDLKPILQSNSCSLRAVTPEKQLAAPDQAQQEDDQASSGLQCVSLEEVTSALLFEEAGNVSRNGSVRQELNNGTSSTTDSVLKSPCPEITPLNPDGPHILEDVTRAEDSGCSRCLCDDGVSQDHVPSTVPSCSEAERREGPMPVSAISPGLEEQGPCPDRKPELSSEDGQQGPLPIDESVHNADLQNGNRPVTVTEVDLCAGGGSDVNGMVSSGCTFVRTEGGGHSGSLKYPKTPDLTIWEIEVPKLLVGRLIGKRGRYMSFLKQKSGAKIHVSPRYYAQELQICHIEGTKHQVHKALGLIRKKFEDLDLTNIYRPPVPSKLPSLPITSWLLLPDEAPVEVTVVKVVSASHMFVQQPKHPSFPALSALHHDMRLCYSQPAPGLPSPTEAGVICAAPGADGGWWRAQVVSLHRDGDEAEVRYVDYGGYQRVKTATLHQIRSDFVTLPFQGAEVVLSNVKPLPGEDGFSAEASRALEEMTRGASLLAQVTSYSDSGIPFIQMWKVVKEELVSVNRSLVDLGLAS